MSSYEEVLIPPGETLPVRVDAERLSHAQITYEGAPETLFVMRAEVWNREVCGGDLTSPTSLHPEVPAGAPFRAWLKNTGTAPVRARVCLS